MTMKAFGEEELVPTAERMAANAAGDAL